MADRRFATAWLAILATVAASCAGASDAADPTATNFETTTPPTTTAGLVDSVTTSLATEVMLDVAGTSRMYRLHIPQPLPTGGAALVVDLHGLGSNPEGQEAWSGMASLGEASGFVVAQPVARGEIPTWNPQPGEPGMEADVAFIRALVADVATQVAIDEGAIFASGFSNGGGMAHRLACNAADLFAAIGTASGQYPFDDVCEPSQPIAVVAFHGTTDLVVPFRGVGELLPDIPTWADGWAKRLVCSPVPMRERLADDVLSDRWTGCAGGVEVLFHIVEGGAHAWPGSDTGGVFAGTPNVAASAVMWEFFQTHARS